MGRQKLAACVEDDIRPPTIQLSRSDHMRRIQSPFHLLRFTLPLIAHFTSKLIKLFLVAFPRVHQYKALPKTKSSTKQIKH